MTSNENKTSKWAGFLLIGALILLAAVSVVRKVNSSNRAASITQLTFQTPADAATALANAAKNGDQTALAHVLGAQIKTLLTSGETDADKAALDGFASKYQQMNRWVDMNDGSRVLYIGADNFAFPVPLAKNSSGQWYFDGVAGAQELRARDIGRNELLAIDACMAVVNAERIYFSLGGESPQFAQLIISTPGKRDGLYWPVPETEKSSPLGHLSKFPKTSLASYSSDQPFVIDGYTLRILTSQGDDAPGGAINYISDGRMVGGFAILATPVKYAETGITTFVIGPDGIVYERDLGPDTIKLANSIQQYNPDDNWSPVEQ